MDRFTYLLSALTANEHRRRAWVISAFALIQEAPDDWKKDPYPFRLVYTPSGVFFVDPLSPTGLTMIQGAPANTPLFRALEPIELKAGQVPNLSKSVLTTVGNLLFNYVALVYPFGNKLPFMTGRIQPQALMDLIVPRLEDMPEEPAKTADVDNYRELSTGAPLVPRDPSKIYIDEYINFTNAMFYLAEFTQLVVPAATPKSMVTDPEMPAYRAKLLEEHKDRLHDPATIAVIDAALVAKDKAWLKGDPSEGFLITKKSFDIVRKKQHLMYGAERGLGEGQSVELITKSLAEGWDTNHFPAMNSASRAGSYDRGAQTMLGGEAVKWLLRASTNITVTQEDCGRTFGVPWQVDDSNYKRLPGFYAILNGKQELVTEDNMGSYLGKKIMVRSPMFCALDKTDYCAMCVGKRLSLSPTALSSAVSAYGSAFLYISLKAMHGKSLQLAHADYRKFIT